MRDDHRDTEILRELGLLPLWVPRSTEPGVQQARLARAEAAPSVAADAAATMTTMVEDEAIVLEADQRISEPDIAVPVRLSRREQIASLAWNELPAHIGACTACGLCRTRRRAVPGVGDPTADWLFVGEAPGAEEDAKGEPFVGQAGRLLDSMLAAIGLDRANNVFIANVLKCRPPGNRDPEASEVEQCRPYLDRQIELLRPRVLVALGRFAAQALLDSQEPIARLRGRVHNRAGIPLVVTYHPAYLLRNLPDKAKAWEDLLLARATLQGLQSGG